MDKLIEKLADSYRIAREEGAIRKWADGKTDAREATDLFREFIKEFPNPKDTEGEFTCCNAFDRGAMAFRAALLAELEDKE